MVHKTFRQGEGCRFVIRPNRSLSWPQTKLVCFSLASVCLVVAILFTAAGFWPVLPFAGAEVVALVVAFYLCARSGRTIEVVYVKKDRVAVEKGSAGSRRICEFKRPWARVALQPARIARHPSRLLVGSHGKQVQLGAFLTEDERSRLAGELERVISSEKFFSGTPAEADATPG
jgi:uncharacterized membrane protein